MHGFDQLIREQEERQAREAADGRYDALIEPDARRIQQEYGTGLRTARAVARVLSRMEGWLWTDVREELLVALAFVEGQCPAEDGTPIVRGLSAEERSDRPVAKADPDVSFRSYGVEDERR